MITEKKKIKLTSSCGETINYTISHDGSCMSISPSTGTVSSGDIVEFTFNLNNEECYNSTITLTYEDSEGVPGDPYIFQLDNECSISGTISNQPTATNPYVFVLNVTANGNYTTVWDYDTTIFDEVGTTNNSLELELINTQQLSTTVVKANITDTTGCEATATYNYAFCQPTANNLVANLVCLEELSNYSSGRKNLPLTVNACAGKTIDWTTLELTYDSSKLLVQQDSEDGSIIQVYAKLEAATKTYNITYRVKDSSGLYSNYATVAVTAPVCTTTNFPVVAIQTIELDPSDVISTIKETRLNSLLLTDEEIDWDSFTFVANTGQTLVSAVQLTTNNGSASFDAANRAIDYTVGTQTENVDLVEYKLSDISGRPSNRGLIYVNYEAKAVPVTVADSYTVGKNSTTELSILSNDTGDIDVTSIEIVTSPTKGILLDNLDGTLNFIADNAEGSDSFTYKVYDTDGRASNTSTVSLTIQNSGTGLTSTICPSAGIDLEDYILGTITSGGTWSKSASNPTDVNITNPNNVNFSSATAGTYQFTYTLSEDATTITLIIPSYSINVTLISGINVTTGQYRFYFTTSGVTSIANITASLDYDSGSVVTTFFPDEFNPSTGEGYVDIYYDDGAGLYELDIDAVDGCGSTQNYSFTWDRS